jgi:hypothetical protein
MIVANLGINWSESFETKVYLLGLATVGLIALTRMVVVAGRVFDFRGVGSKLYTNAKANQIARAGLWGTLNVESKTSEDSLSGQKLGSEVLEESDAHFHLLWNEAAATLWLIERLGVLVYSWSCIYLAYSLTLFFYARYDSDHDQLSLFSIFRGIAAILFRFTIGISTGTIVCLGAVPLGRLIRNRKAKWIFLLSRLLSKESN